MTPEEKYRLLLQVSQAANGELDFAAVLGATARALAPVLPLHAVAVVTLRGDRLLLHAVHIEGVPHRPGETAAETLAHAVEHEGDKFKAGKFIPPPDGVPREGSGTDFVGRTGKAYVCQDLEAERLFTEDDRLLAYGVRAYVRAPLFVQDRLIGSIAFSRFEARRFAPEEVELLEEVSRPIATAVSNSLAFEEIARLKNQLEAENLFLREELDEKSLFGEIVGSSEVLRRMLARVEKVARTDSTVLLVGETGTGKELVANEIHRRSPRSGRALIKVNCAALPETLIASELFGHERGAFTGALERRQGRFELASGGTLFLDEVGELSIEMQVALLRVLQEGEFERVGGRETLKANTRLIAATNQSLSKEAAEGRFRSDLFYRLNVFPIEMPALRDRKDDIPILVEYFASRHGARLGKKFKRVDRKTMEKLLAYSWPGNVRELENVIERAAILSEGEKLSVDDAFFEAQNLQGTAAAGTLREQEKRVIEAALAKSRGRVSGAAGAAARLGVPSTTLESKIKKLKIDKYRFRAASGDS